MTIDIINYTAEQFAVLSVEKLLEIREAQTKKNALLKELEKKLDTEKRKLVDRGIYPSDAWSKIERILTKEYDAKVKALREALKFYLRYVADGRSDIPYKVDYSLSEEARVAIVKEYYNTTYADANKRYNAFKADTFVKSYVGELYLPLHDYFYAAS